MSFIIMTKTSTEDPSEVVRLVLTLFILGPFGSTDNSILFLFFHCRICSISFKSGEKFKKFEDKVHFENFSTLGANIC